MLSPLLKDEVNPHEPVTLGWIDLKELVEDKLPKSALKANSFVVFLFPLKE